jgi:hypothetical protein
MEMQWRGIAEKLTPPFSLYAPEVDQDMILLITTCIIFCLQPPM